MPNYAWALILLLLVGLCVAEDKTPPLLDPKFQAQLIEIAATYSKWEPADKDMRVAPAPCAAFPGINPEALWGSRTSKSTDTKTHGRKLYLLYPKDASAYNPLKATQPVGQVLVKESWVPLKHEGDNEKDKRLESGDLFVMFKLDPQTPGTDQGWVYGTVSADGKSVTSSGRVASCMKCHEDTRHDRMFGLPKPEKK
jgi:hypothetical protein